MPFTGIYSSSPGGSISNVPAQGIFQAHGSRKAAVPTPHRSSLGFYGRLLSIWLSLWGYGWALLVVIVTAWVLRAHNPHYSSAYMDESIYVLYGRMFLSRHFEAPIDQPLHFSFGWYLWPILAAWADRLGGLVGVRELAAAMGTLTVCSVYAFARRLFSLPWAWHPRLYSRFSDLLSSLQELPRETQVRCSFSPWGCGSLCVPGNSKNGQLGSQPLSRWLLRFSLNT